MILEELKEYLVTNQIVTLNELTEHFATDESVLREMLAVWEKKGKVRKIDSDFTSCGKCAQCYHLPEEIYQWVE